MNTPTKSQRKTFNRKKKLKILHNVLRNNVTKVARHGRGIHNLLPHAEPKMQEVPDGTKDSTDV